MDRSQTIVRILSWAAHDDNIRAVVATGSFARDTMDPYSDLDIELYVGEPAQLLDQDKWYQQFGTVLVVEALENQGWNPTRLVYYAGGKTDFKILAASLLQRGVEFVLSVCS
jgi:aminoglycoside 6-adenylyltransferase